MSNTIPSEIVLHILKQLPNDDLVQCIVVCKRWSYLSCELLWYKPILARSKNWIAFFQVIQSTHTSFPYTCFIRRINLAPLSSLVENSHVLTLNVCVRLERLTLAGCSQLTDAGLCGLINKDNNLISIDLSDVHHITDTTLIKVALCCPHLQGFNLSMSQEQVHITDIGVVALATQCKDLKRVTIFHDIPFSFLFTFSLLRLN
jgi:F-box and leucine-rich repeat protein GRR1